MKKILVKYIYMYPHFLKQNVVKFQSILCVKNASLYP